MWQSKREISRECNDIIGSAKGSQISEKHWGEVGSRAGVYLEVKKRRGHIFFEWNKCLWTWHAKLTWSSDFTTKCLEKLGLISEWKSFTSCQNDLSVLSEIFHNVKLNKLWNNIDWPRKLIEFSASKPSPDGTGSTSAPPPLERCCTWWL